MDSACPFLSGTLCSIYAVRPEGCRRFPDTAYAMLSVDCDALNRFKKQHGALVKGRKRKEAYYSTTQPIQPSELSEKQYKNCIAKLQRAGITEDELALFCIINGAKKRKS
jgi:Fe-S-cluster containining protein